MDCCDHSQRLSMPGSPGKSNCLVIESCEESQAVQNAGAFQAMAVAKASGIGDVRLENDSIYAPEFMTEISTVAPIPLPVPVSEQSARNLFPSLLEVSPSMRNPL